MHPCQAISLHPSRPPYVTCHFVWQLLLPPLPPPPPPPPPPLPLPPPPPSLLQFVASLLLALPPSYPLTTLQSALAGLIWRQLSYGKPTAPFPVCLRPWSMIRALSP